MSLKFYKIQSSLLFNFFLFVFFVFTVKGQDLKNDELTILLQKITDTKYANPQLAETYATQLLEKSQTNNIPEWEFHAYHQLGRIANIKGDYKNAILHSEKAILIGKILKKNLLEFEGLLTKGNALVYLGRNEEALNHYLKALTIAKRYKDPIYEIRSSASVAKVKRRIGQAEEALKMYKRNLDLALKNKVNDKIAIINSYMGVGGTHLRLNNPDSTIYYSSIGLEKSLEINDLEGVGYFYNDLGMAYFKKKEYENAIQYLKKAEKNILSLKNKTRLTETYFFLGSSYYQLNNYDKAIYFLNEIERIIEQQNKNALHQFNPPELLPTYQLLADAYKKKNDKSKSLAYTEKYIALDKDYDNHKDAVVKALFENKDNDVQQLSDLNSKQKTRFYLLTIIFIGVFIISVLLLIQFLRVRKAQKKAFNQLIVKTTTEKKQSKSPKEFQIQDKKVDDILKRLEKLEASQFFLDHNCNLQSLAKKVKTNVNYLSQVISTYKNKSFYEYINELRIQYAIKRLQEDPKFRKYSIKHIGEELGYKSTNSFTKYFKAHTDLYPSYYIKRLLEEEKK
ncbi:tetratricopeptide repeat protein [Flavobacteriaceae bacterium R38]|nr:tetratricopeptide repeat protein [Flavobacteriaceae bacterium R38]